MIEPHAMNIYWIKNKLRAAADQAMSLVISHWVVGTLYLRVFFHFTTRPMWGLLREGNDQCRYMPATLFF